MTNLLHTYYKGVLERLRLEVELLNQIIPHNPTKGTANEDALKSILKQFIPSRYSVGSGVIIDSFGNNSRQIDLLIYDGHLYSQLFSQGYTALYPVETVIATIEIKTYLDNSKLEDVRKNTEFIRNLRHYTEKIVINQPSSENPLHIIEYPTRPPSSHLFAYRLDSQNLATWKDRFYNCSKIESTPDTSILLDIASVFHFSDSDKRTLEDIEYGFFALRCSDAGVNGPPHGFIDCKKPNFNVVINNQNYKSSSFEKDGRYPLLMPERSFLSFILRLHRLIEIWPKHISFDPTKYLDPDYTKFHSL